MPARRASSWARRRAVRRAPSSSRGWPAPAVGDQADPLGRRRPGSSSGRPRSTSRSSSSGGQHQASAGPVSPADHAGQAGVQREVDHRPPGRRRPAGVVERAETAEQLGGVGQGRGRRWVEEGELVGRRAPHGQLQGQTRPGRPAAISGGANGPPGGVLDLRTTGGRRRRARAVRPARPAGRPRPASAAVVCSRVSPLRASMAGPAHLPAVDHDPDAVDGQARLGDVGGQHDPPAPRGRRGEGQRPAPRVGGCRAAAGRRRRRAGPPSRPADPADVARPRGGTRARRPSRPGPPRATTRGDGVVRPDLEVREAANGCRRGGSRPGLVDDRSRSRRRRRAGPPAGWPRAWPTWPATAQVGAQAVAGVEGEGQGQVGLQVALVDLVEDDQRRCRAGSGRAGAGG